MLFLFFDVVVREVNEQKIPCIEMHGAKIRIFFEISKNRHKISQRNKKTKIFFVNRQNFRNFAREFFN